MARNPEPLSANFKGEVKQITNEWADYGSIALANNGNKLLATKASMSHPTDIYIVTPGKNARVPSRTDYP